MKKYLSLSTARILILAVAVLASCVFLSACGRKTPPEAPEDRAPKPITDLKIETTRNSIRLFWKAPTQNMKGDDLIGLESFVVSRREYRLAQSDDFEEVATIKIEDKETYGFADSKVELGKTYDYIISAISDEGVEGVQESFARITFKGEQSTSSITPYIPQEAQQ